MIFSLIVLIIVGGVAYFHYVQGFFSATLSAICAVFAAVLAVGYYETVVNAFLGGKAADYAEAMVLCGLFALIYTILRLIADSFVPGNVRLPVLMDKVGAGAMGVVAGLFCGGIFAIAGQLLPFGPTIGGYSRQPTLADRQVTVNVGQRSQASDLYVYDELSEKDLDPARDKSLIVPADNLVVGLTNKLSSGGALAGARPLSSVHPDLLTEAFGQRLGIQVGAKRIGYNTDAQQQFTLDKLYRLTEVASTDSDIPGMRRDPEKPSVIRKTGDAFFLVVRVNVSGDAGDEQDHKFRFSLGSVRICDGSFDYWPIGTLEDGVLFKSRADDFLFKPSDKDAIDLVFDMDAATILKDPAALRSGAPAVKDGVFIEIKRMGRIDLSGQPINGAPPASKKVGLQWKKPVLDARPPAIGAAPRPAAVDAAGATVDFKKVEVSPKLFTKINVGLGDADMPSVTFASGTAALKGRKFTRLKVDPTQSLQIISSGEYTVDELAAPEGRKIVQVQLTPKSADPWAWDDLTKFELSDAAGGKYKPLGAVVKLKQGTSDRLIAAYDAEQGAQSIGQVEGRPLDVYLIFATPAGATLNAIKHNGKVISTMDVKVP